MANTDMYLPMKVAILATRNMWDTSGQQLPIGSYYFLIRQTKMEAKYDTLQVKMFKSISRSNRAMEAVAKLPPPAEVNGDS